MRAFEFLAFLALVGFAGLGFWRGLRTKPSRGYRGETVGGASNGPYVALDNGQSDRHGGGR
jgi:hypothetical protein